MAAAQRKTVLKVARKALLAAVASLPDAEALERLTVWQEAEGPGVRRRALLAARIALMRRLLAAEPVVQVLPPLPAPEPEPVIEEPPPALPPKPAKTKRTSMTTFSMEDAAALLMSAATAMEEPFEGDETPPPPDETPVAEDLPEAAVEDEKEAAIEPEFVAAPWIDAAALLNALPDAAPEAAEPPLAEVVEEAEVVPEAGPAIIEITDVDAVEVLDTMPARDKRFDAPAPKRRSEQVRPVLPMDIGAQLAAIAEENDGKELEALAAFAAAPKKAGKPQGLDDNLAALEGLGDLDGDTASAPKGARKAGKGKPVAVADMGAQFAALDALRDAEVVEIVKGPAKPSKTIDLSAQFAAMQDPDSTA